MEIYVSVKSKVFIITNDGQIRKPDISEVELSDSNVGSELYFEGTITDEKITKCRCNDDEIILEKTKDDVMKISTAYNVNTSTYSSVLGLALQGNYKLLINRCEGLSDMYELDKIVESYMQSFKKST